eukprot:gnl/TRDRNA2_/TRDRNA2_78072_c0_seq1.p1 gnl/TRDRNA2_/TRDRNA2_78072_c0~~gnl/TRDRNA2_/TRDRNA2_78072_c0_seq1.p1  ORF type:complete len:375 (-),score=75.53 gnl/TRDRNA2_/TRDRNA2_78072_c0_seq1:20-982(-)
MALHHFEAAENALGGRMCNAKIVILQKQLGRRTDGEAYAGACGLSYDQLHLQNPRIPTQPWWQLEDPRLPRWVRSLASRAAVRKIRGDLQRCLHERESAGGFDDSGNDWFFVGERQRWTGLNLMHSGRGGWQDAWCAPGACAESTCRRLQGRRELEYGLWPELREGVLAAPATLPSPPMYVNFYSLAPGAHIIPHLGNDARLTAHLALEVPAGNQSRIRVADRIVNYTHAGQVLVFDDAYEHEVWNDSNETRYVLGITFWHPELLRRLPPRASAVLSSDEQTQQRKPFQLWWQQQQQQHGHMGASSAVCRGRILCVVVPG